MRRLFPRCLCQPLAQCGYFAPDRLSFITSQRVSLGTTGPRSRKSLRDTNVTAGEGGRKRGKEANDAVQSLLRHYDIDILKVVQRYPPVQAYDVQRVERVVLYLAGLGVDVKRVVEKHPTVLAGKVEAYDVVVQWLRHNGVDVARVVGADPSVLSRRIGTLQEIGDAICGCGHSLADVAHRVPSIFRTSSADASLVLQLRKLAHGPREIFDKERPSGEVDRKLALLSSLGLDANRLLRKAPQVLRCSSSKLFAVAEYLNKQGLDSRKIAQSAPHVLGQRPEALQTRLQFFAENGLDALKHVNGTPTVLACSVERKLQPTLKFLIEEMGRTRAELDNAYNLWSYDLNGRLRPRLLYLRSLGKEPRKGLAHFGSFSDQRFAASFAKTDLEHYYAWRRQNGYPVPREQCRVDPAAHPTAGP
eukprot:EG_transcript_11705